MNSRDLDNWITGHYGEDYFKDEDAMDDKQDITIHIAISLPIKEAETLAEFLSDLINKTMGKEAIVSYTKENKREKTNEEILIELGYYPNEIKKILDELDESDEP